MVLPASALVLLTAAGCNEERVSYDGPQYIMFSDTLYTLPVQNDVEMFDIPVVSMYADDNDRTLAVEIIDKESNAVEGAHLQSSVGNYPKIVHSLNMKKGRSDTPLS